jgi:threonine dehydratase
VVEEEAVREGVRLLLTREKLVAEPSGALGLAALLSHPGRFAGGNLAVVISGGNLDNRLLQDVAAGPAGQP